VSHWPFVASGVALISYLFVGRLREPWPKVLLPLATAVIFISVWHVACEMMTYPTKQLDGSIRIVEVFPTPWETLVEMKQPLRDGTLLRFAIASVYRVAVGFTIATAIGVPLGLWAGWFSRGAQAINPLVQALRPISPIAWIPLAVLWFGVKDASAIFLIALASFFPIVTGTMTAVRTIPVVFVRSAQNFGLEGFELFRRVVFPAAMPQIITSLRLALGIAWMVIVAAEMIAVDSGLGYMIMDSRNANNYERVLGSMIAIGIIGVGLDFLVRRLERFDEVRWGFPNERGESETDRVRKEVAKARSRSVLKAAANG
jgi:NitT/TauT family transport system permease protein